MLERVLAVLGAAVVLGVGLAVVILVTRGSDDEQAVSTPPAAKTAPKPTATAKPKPRRPRLTPAQRASRDAAIEQMRLQGFTPVSTTSYRPRQTLRVLIGKPRASTAGKGRRAFFFVREEYIGTDAAEASRKLKVVRQAEGTITLAYGLTDGSTTRVRFSLGDGRLQPLDAIPAAASRLP